MLRALDSSSKEMPLAFLACLIEIKLFKYYK